MNNEKIGNLIFNLRTEKGLTQKELADALYISDRTVSKWERGLGCPDVSLLPKLSTVLQVDVEKLLLGELNQNRADSGNLSRMKFYLCPACGNVITATGNADLHCCGRKLEPMKARQPDADHRIAVEELDDEYYLTFDHPMTKEHALSFVAHVAAERVLFVKLYPEQGGELRLPRKKGGRLYYACGKHGLFVRPCRPGLTK